MDTADSEASMFPNMDGLVQFQSLNIILKKNKSKLGLGEERTESLLCFVEVKLMTNSSVRVGHF